MKYLLLVLSVLLLIQCQKLPESKNPCPDDGACHFEILNQSRLNVQENQGYLSLQTAKGSNLVFCYRYEKADQPNLADDEYKEELFFEIPSGLDSFELQDEKLERANATFGRLCFCADGGYHKITKGKISGKKIRNGSWEISCNLEINTTRAGHQIGNYPKIFVATFSTK